MSSAYKHAPIAPHPLATHHKPFFFCVPLVAPGRRCLLLGLRVGGRVATGAEDRENHRRQSAPDARAASSWTWFPPNPNTGDRQMELLEEMRSMLKAQNEKIESMYKENQELREKVSFLSADISRLGGYLQQPSVPRILSDQNCSILLRFVNSCSDDKYSKRKIEADDGNLLKVALYGYDNKIITYEPFSSMRVQIVAIQGDFDHDHKGQWTEEYFRSKIVIGRPGKENLLSGNLYFRLQNGVGYLNSAKFQDNSSFVPSKRFKLGIMAADERISERIQEGITESFAVKDIRGLSTKKSGNPSPGDPVYKLNKIAMNGDRHKSLERKGIKTVGEFSTFYMKSPEDLRKLMGKISDHDWDTIVNHALKCNPRPGIHSSYIQESNMSHEHEPVTKGNGSFQFNGSCSLQQFPTIQKQLDVQEAQRQQISSTSNGLSSGLSSENVLKFSAEQLEGIQIPHWPVSSVGNEILPVSSRDNNTLQGSSSEQRYSLDKNTTSEAGNGVLPSNPSTDGTFDDGYLSRLAKDLFEDGSWGDYGFSETGTGDSCNVAEHSGGFSSDNETRYTPSYGGFSPASEEGSVSYGGVSPASEAGSISYKYSPSPNRSVSYKYSPSPIRKAGSVIRGGLSPVREADSRF
ncbi:hypothetical protein ACP70R_020945 [Stipagrostis hirtigluma subsp. patula]